jgi:hypothetical protein
MRKQKFLGHKRDNIMNSERSGPLTKSRTVSSVETVTGMVAERHQWTLQNIAEEPNVSEGTMRLCLATYLEMKEVCAKKITIMSVTSNNLGDRFFRYFRNRIIHF